MDCRTVSAQALTVYFLLYDRHSIFLVIWTTNPQKFIANAATSAAMSMLFCALQIAKLAPAYVQIPLYWADLGKEAIL